MTTKPTTADLIEALVKSHPLAACCGVTNADLYRRAKAIAEAARAEDDKASKR